MKKKLLVSFSGGETSAYMTHYILNNLKDEYKVVVVFANTGREEEATLEFVNYCDHYLGFNTVWVEAVVHHGSRKGCTHRIVNFDTASRNGEPFEQVISKYGIPNVNFLHCTRELKRNPIHSYAKTIFGTDYLTAIGVRADEVDRIRKGKYFYPLIKMGVKKEYINAFWGSMFFRLSLNEKFLPKHLSGYRGNCKKCFKKTLMKLVETHRDEANGICPVDTWVEDMERDYGNFVPDGQQKGRTLPIRFSRNHLPASEIRELSKLPDDEIKKKMSRKKVKVNLSNGCTESCEVF